MKSCEWCKYGRTVGWTGDFYICKKIKKGNNIKAANDLCEHFKKRSKK